VGGSADRRCRHNLVYWANHAYYGFGTGAAAYVDGLRTLNTRELASYIQRCRDGRSPVTQSERLEPEERARETAMLQLRRREGIDRRSFLEQTGFELDALGAAPIRTFVKHGLLEDSGRSVRLTRAGMPVADGILRSLL
jgi:oxygen-independent coproporphyrinogen-3 oxidase